MSTCISSHGEYSDHIPDDQHTCTRCGVLDEDGLIDELTKIRARLAEVEALVPEGWEPFIEPLERRLVVYVKTAIADADAQRAKQRHVVRELAEVEKQRDMAIDQARMNGAALAQAVQDRDDARYGRRETDNTLDYFIAQRDAAEAEVAALRAQIAPPVSHTYEQLARRQEVTQARLDALLRSARIWRAWWDGKGGPHVVNLVEKIDLISSYEAKAQTKTERRET